MLAEEYEYQINITSGRVKFSKILPFSPGKLLQHILARRLVETDIKNGINGRSMKARNLTNSEVDFIIDYFENNRGASVEFDLRKIRIIV
jgi:hypothetical protein